MRDNQQTAVSSGQCRLTCSFLNLIEARLISLGLEALPFLCLLNEGRFILDDLVAFVLRTWEQLGEREPLTSLEMWNESVAYEWVSRADYTILYRSNRVQNHVSQHRRM